MKVTHTYFVTPLFNWPLSSDFDQQDVFILGDPAASFDRSGGHSYDRKSSNPHAGFPEWKKIFSYILRDCLVVFLPPALGAYVLSQHRTKVSSSLSSADDASMQDEPHTLRINQSSLLTPPAVINYQAEQIANARRRAAEGSLAPYTIPLLANTQTRSSKNRVTWTLKFTLPAPADEGTTRRFSAVPRGYGPSGAPALEGAVRYAYPFDYQHEATTLLPNSDFLSLPDHVTQYGPVRAQTLGLYIPDSIRAWLLSGAPRIYDRKDLELPGNRQIALPSILTRYFCSELTIHQFEALLNARQAEDDKELDVAATECRRMKRAKQTLSSSSAPCRL